MTIMVCIVLLALSIALYDYFDSREWQHVTSVQRNNFVFEDRNKKYGAYSIRRDYNDLVMLILVCVLGAVGVFKVINSAFIDKTAVIAVVPAYDTVAITLEAPPMQEIETVKTPYKIEGGGGSGTASNAKYDATPDLMVKNNNTIDKSDAHTTSGHGNQTNSDNKTNTATTTNVDPFAHGTGGAGGGEHGGQGNGLGDDNGNGQGDGNGPGTGGRVVRKLIKAPNANNIQSDEACVVVLNVTINADGEVVSTSPDREKSTTTNSTIISQVAALVKREARYTAASGARNVTLQLKVRISAN